MEKFNEWFLKLDLEATEYRFFSFLLVWGMVGFAVMFFKLFQPEIVTAGFILLMLIFLCLRGIQEELREKRNERKI